jgi:PAS domain S-box-containing protein
MLIIMLTVTSTLCLTGIVLSINEYYVFRSLGARSISTLSQVVGSNSIAALAFNDEKVASEILTALAKEPEILVGCLYMKDKKLFATYIKDKTNRHCPETLPAYGHSYSGEKLSFSESIIRENEVLGSFYIVSQMSNFQQRLKLYLFLLVGLIIGASIFAFWIASRLHHLVTGPILHLADTASFISKEGKYSLRAEESTEVEINVLVNAFNRMLDAIQEREEKIVQSEEQFRAAFELAAVGNSLVGPDGKFLRVNSELCKMLDYSSEELLHMTFHDITYPDDIPRSIEVHNDMFDSKYKSCSFEKRYLTKSKSCLWVMISVATIQNQAGKVMMLISVIQNITERKLAEQERDRLLKQERKARLLAEKSIQMRDDFLSIASHELRTPITPMKLHFRLIKNQMKNLKPDLFPHQESLLKAFEISERQIENLEKLVEAMLSVSRITSGQLALTKKKVDLSHIVRSALERYQSEGQITQLKVDLDADPDVIGFWDELKIEQAFVNVFTNAIKYGVGKNIDITVKKVGEKAILRVKDYGIGMSEENSKRVFEKFERVGSIKHISGLGLGLYIAKEYVSAHKGTIQVESILNEGSTFTIELPLGT